MRVKSEVREEGDHNRKRKLISSISNVSYFVVHETFVVFFFLFFFFLFWGGGGGGGIAPRFFTQMETSP